MKISDATKNTIQTTLLNFISNISEDEDIEIRFSQDDNGVINELDFHCVRQSKNPSVIKSTKLKDNKLCVDISAIRGVKVDIPLDSQETSV